MTLASRFQGASGKRLLIDSLKNQPIVRGDDAIANALASVATLEEFGPGGILIRQDYPDNHLYLILVGRVLILVNGRAVANREAGQHVGEMCAIDPAASRSATVVATQDTVVARIEEKDLSAVANGHPYIWRTFAVELGHRLNQRRQFHIAQNPKPILFIGSSTESLPPADELRDAIPAVEVSVTLWNKGVFGVSRYLMEDLAAQMKIADFAALIAGADDKVASRGGEFDAPRDNVIFELGLFMGALSRQRTFLIVPKGVDLKIPSDLLGLTLLKYDLAGKTAEDRIGSARDGVMAVITALGPK